jgi:Tol biopolymer transport system component
VISSGPRDEVTSVSGDGRYVAFIGNENTYTLKLLDCQTGIIQPLLEGVADVMLSDDGSLISYVKYNGGYFDAGSNFDVFRLDLSTGVTTRITESPEGTTSGAYWSEGPISKLAMSPDGRFIMFFSNVPGLARIELPLDWEGKHTNGDYTYLYDHSTGVIELTNLDSNGEPITQGVLGFFAGLSPDGRYVGFTAGFDQWHTYIRDRESGRTILVSGNQANGRGLITGNNLIISIWDDRANKNYYLVPIADLFDMPTSP